MGNTDITDHDNIVRNDAAVRAARKDWDGVRLSKVAAIGVLWNCSIIESWAMDCWYGEFFEVGKDPKGESSRGSVHPIDLCY